MDNIKNILPYTLKSIGISRKFGAQSVIVHWGEIVGPEIAAHATAVSVAAGSLRVVVNSPVWSHHLMMLRQNLIEKINKFAGEKVISHIHFTIGSGKMISFSVEESIGENVDFSMPLLSEAEIEDIRGMVAEVQDVNLRNKILYAIIKQVSFKKMRVKQKWHSCRQCGVLCLPEKEYCTVCTLEQKNLRLNALYDLIRDLPWCGYQEIKKYVECNTAEFTAAKRRLMNKLKRKVIENKADGMVKAGLVMAMTGKTPQELSQEQIDGVINKIMEKAGGKDHVFTSRG